MSYTFHPSRFNEVASGNVAARSAAAINAQRANRWAMSCPGARAAKRYIMALVPGGGASATS
jgi:hypothetical protein